MKYFFFFVLAILLAGGLYVLLILRDSSIDDALNALPEENRSEHISRVSPELLLDGGPPKDGIPAIDDPKFVTTEESKFSDDELVVGVYLNGEARAYPYGILNWHEIVNDRIGDTPIAVTLCPLCDTTPVFLRLVDGEETTFGVSGRLFQSCLVMYDRLTDTLWSQPWGIGIMGKQVNQGLKRLPAVKTTLGAWKKRYPETMVLSSDTGYNRDYFKYPYGTYVTNETLFSPVRSQEKRRGHPKDVESYIWWRDGNENPENEFFGDSYHISHKQAQEQKEMKFVFKGKETWARWDEEFQTVRFYRKDEEIPSSSAFAFVYPAFFRE